jgi:two-component system, LytTR family, response regulator AlgR
MRPRVMIVDDEAPARSRMKMLLSDIAESCPHELIAEAGSGQEALRHLDSLSPDLLLLDVQMPGMNGLELAALVMQRPQAPAIVFVTAFDDFALQAFDVHALDYLLKPVRAVRLAEAIRRAAAIRLNSPDQLSTVLAGPAAVPFSQPARRQFSVQERGKVILVPVQEVLYCKAELKYVTLRTRDAEYLIEASLTSIEDEFADRFVRVHRNALVARDAIAGVERVGTVDVRDTADGGAVPDRGQDGWQVIVRGLGERLPISRRQWPIVKSLVR